MATVIENAAVPRSVVRIPAADGEELEAWLYRPSGNGPHPVIVMGHGMGAIKACGLTPFAERFCRAGFAVIAFDYRHWGGSSGQPRDFLSLPKQREDYRTVIGWADADPRFDSQRIFAWGISFAGMHIVELAASDSRLAGVIAQCPLVDSVAGAGTVPMSHALRLFALALWDNVCSLFGASPIYVPLAVAPGEWGMLASKDAAYGRKLTEPKDGTEWHNRLAARSLLTYLGSRPVRRAAAIRCPILLIVADKDVTVPVEPILRIAELAPHAELHRVLGGHSDGLAGGVAHDQVLALETDFLIRHATAAKRNS